MWPLTTAQCKRRTSFSLRRNSCAFQGSLIQTTAAQEKAMTKTRYHSLAKTQSAERTLLMALKLLRQRAKVQFLPRTPKKQAPECQIRQHQLQPSTAQTPPACASVTAALLSRAFLAKRPTKINLHWPSNKS